MNIVPRSLVTTAIGMASFGALVLSSGCLDESGFDTTASTAADDAYPADDHFASPGDLGVDQKRDLGAGPGDAGPQPLADAAADGKVSSDLGLAPDVGGGPSSDATRDVPLDAPADGLSSGAPDGAADAPLDAPCPGTICGQSCVDTSSNAQHCGGCDKPCGAIANGSVSCVSGQCQAMCGAGFCRVGELVCVANTSNLTCGAGCQPCTAAPANAVPTCATGACDFLCNSGFHRCGNECKADDDADACGPSCLPCPAGAARACEQGSCKLKCGVTVCDPAPPNATIKCNGDACEVECAPGHHACPPGSSVCVPDDSVTQCGASCSPCTAPPGITPACVGGTCKHKCGPNVCQTPASATTSCNGDTCEFSCEGGFCKEGANLCVPNTSPAACGVACKDCPLPGGDAFSASRACVNGHCVARCDGMDCPEPQADEVLTCAGGCKLSCRSGHHYCPDSTMRGHCHADTDPDSCVIEEKGSCQRCAGFEYRQRPSPTNLGCVPFAAGGRACVGTCTSGERSCNFADLKGTVDRTKVICPPLDDSFYCGSGCVRCDPNWHCEPVGNDYKCIPD